LYKLQQSITNFSGTIFLLETLICFKRLSVAGHDNKLQLTTNEIISIVNYDFIEWKSEAVTFVTFKIRFRTVITFLGCHYSQAVQFGVEISI